MRGRVEPVGAAGEEGDGASARAERGLVRDRVDPEGGSGDDEDAALGGAGGEVRGDVLAVAGRRASPDDGQPMRSGEGERIAAAPEHERRVLPQIGERLRPAVAARQQEACIETVRDLQAAEEQGPVDPGAPARQTCGEDPRSAAGVVPVALSVACRVERVLGAAGHRGSVIRASGPPPAHARRRRFREDLPGGRRPHHLRECAASAESADQRPAHRVARLGERGPRRARERLHRIGLAVLGKQPPREARLGPVEELGDGRHEPAPRRISARAR